MDSLPQITAEDVGLSTSRLARIDGWMDQLVASGKLPGVSVAVARRGRLAYTRCTGMADIARATPMAAETIVRIYSMTKPLTSACIMMLYEEGRFQLDDPITRFLPYFANQRVAAGGNSVKLETVPAERDITFRDLLTHTSGLTYGFMSATLIDAMYRAQGIDFQTSDLSLGDVVEKAAALPLLAQPGTAWNYSIATDVLGHLVAVISGQSFESFMQERILTPLGMNDTSFIVPTDKVARFAANYYPSPEGLQIFDDPATSRFTQPGKIASGGGGLCGTSGDYLRFAQMMLNKGIFNGQRLLGRKTVDLMTSNHLGGDMASMGQKRFSESNYEGVGFGLGFSVMLDPARAQSIGTPGEFAWGGAASTGFWVDPAEEMVVVLFTQLTPSSTYPIRRELRALTYAAVID